jgi:hypothetical protein
VSVPDGRRDERSRRRVAFFEANYLHLNRGKGLWTWFADVYAVGLLLLACTGIFIVSGTKGLGGRGRWLLLAGLAIPIAYLAGWRGRGITLRSALAVPRSLSASRRELASRPAPESVSWWRVLWGRLVQSQAGNGNSGGGRKD